MISAASDAGLSAGLTVGDGGVLPLTALLLVITMLVGGAIAMAVRLHRLRRRDRPRGGSARLAAYHAAEARLGEVQEMLARGEITMEEYRERRRRIIGGIDEY
jgi:uncharacterized membrane protein